MNDDNKLKTAAGMSALWDGQAIRRVRAGDGASILQGRRLSAHLMAQPDVAAILFRDRLLADQGQLSRTLATAPDSAAGTRLWHEERPETDRDLKRYGAHLLEILEARLPLAAGKSNELEPRDLPLAPEARRLWIRFADHVEKAIARNGALQPIKGLANKLPEHAARLGAVLTLVEDIYAADLKAEHMRAGIALAEHYAAEALRLFEASRVNADLQLAQRLLDWLQHQCGDLAAGHLPAQPERDPRQSNRRKVGRAPRGPWVGGTDTGGRRCCWSTPPRRLAHYPGVLNHDRLSKIHRYPGK
jgi:hypothetical protein